MPFPSIHRIAFVVNANKSGARQLAEKLADTAVKSGREVRLTQDYPLQRDFLADMDACCVLGGDGTLLSVVEESVRHQVPVFGINQGKLGFLATYAPETAIQSLNGILEGNFQIVHRSVLRCTPAGGPSRIALNDIVFKSADVSHMVALEVFCDEELVTDYYCDGLIFCTPTGSTAYNLSAGGPIVNPGATVLTMTPISPHTLTNRSVVFPGKAHLRVWNVNNADNVLVTHDGSPFPREEVHFPLEVCFHDQGFPLLQPLDHSHFHILRHKLRWGSERDRFSGSYN